MSANKSTSALFSFKDRRRHPHEPIRKEMSLFATLLSSLWDTLTSRHHSRDFIFAHAHYLRNRVLAVGLIFAVLSPLWVLVDGIMLPHEIQAYTQLGRLMMTLGFIGVLWLAWHSVDKIRRIRLSAGLLLALPAAFYALVLFLMPPGGSRELAGYSFIPFLLVATLSIFPFTLIESLLAGLAMLALLSFAQYVQGSWMTPQGLQEQWLLGTLLVVALTANHFQLGLLLRLYRQATHDALTGLLNRGALERRLAELARSGDEHTYSLLMMDIDHFKMVNDTHGHSVGDKVLREFARLLALQVRAGDCVARYGGEEFVVILLDTDRRNAALVAERVRAAIEQATLFDHDGNPVPVTTSVGVACHVRGEGTETTLKRADDSLYQAKESGRNRICINECA
ncbi:GGDEF domain-containing protein [Halomonas sp. Bachu 37]|uniref:GGDEF domain-containing protein n=1 Tax=Halomonas kashgarensis TaxID=3084920 RepID=UPI003217B4E8